MAKHYFYDKVMTLNHKTLNMICFQIPVWKDAQKLLYAEAIFVCRSKQIIFITDFDIYIARGYIEHRN